MSTDDGYGLKHPALQLTARSDGTGKFRAKFGCPQRTCLSKCQSCDPVGVMSRVEIQKTLVMSVVDALVKDTISTNQCVVGRPWSRQKAVEHHRNWLRESVVGARGHRLF